MNSTKTSGAVVAATLVRWSAVGVAVTATVLWLMDAIKAPVGIFAGAAAILVILASGRHRRNGS